MRFRVGLVGCGVAAVLGLLLPIFALLSGASVILICLVTFGSIGWFSFGLVLLYQQRVADAVDESTQLLGHPPTKGNVVSKVSQFVANTLRYHRASYTVQLERQAGASDVGASLRRIASLAYQELGAKAVELSLFDEESGLWSQAVILGAPTSIGAQPISIEAFSGMETGSYSSLNDQAVLSEPLRFSGTLFGAIRVELSKGKKPSEVDMQVMKLLALQAAIVLVDSQFTDQLLRMRKLGDESVKAKTGFLANLSHELRGPLGIILNSAELMLDGLCGEITESQDETLRMLMDAGNHLLDLVNDVLDYAKVEAGKITAKPVELPVRGLLEDLVAVIRTEATAKKHKLRLKPVPEEMGVLCDKRHIRQMLINFLTNAVKYTPDGGEITVWAEYVDGGAIKISVKDSGIGIPADQVSKVFSAFERVEDNYAQRQTGTGLGMPLTRRLAEVNGGEVNFETTSGEGSTFWLILPATQLGLLEGDSEDEETPAAMHGNGETILLVDPDKETTSLLTRYLENQGFVVVNATSGREVIKILRDKDIKLAVVENDLPDLSGEEMISTIRSSPKAATVPIILLSAKAFVFDVERFLKLGVDRCLSKPVPLKELAVCARRLIDQTS